MGPGLHHACRDRRLTHTSSVRACVPCTTSDLELVEALARASQPCRSTDVVLSVRPQQYRKGIQ